MILDKFNLEGKVAIVTGAARGLGQAIAIGLAEAGADIIGVSASLEESGSAIEAAVREIGIFRHSRHAESYLSNTGVPHRYDKSRGDCRRPAELRSAANTC